MNNKKVTLLCSVREGIKSTAEGKPCSKYTKFRQHITNFTWKNHKKFGLGEQGPTSYSNYCGREFEPCERENFLDFFQHFCSSILSSLISTAIIHDYKSTKVFFNYIFLKNPRKLWTHEENILYRELIVTKIKLGSLNSLRSEDVSAALFPRL